MPVFKGISAHFVGWSRWDSGEGDVMYFVHKKRLVIHKPKNW